MRTKTRSAGESGARAVRLSEKGNYTFQTFFLSRVRDSLILSTRSSLFPSNFNPSFHCLIQLYLLMSFSGNWSIKKQRKKVNIPRSPSYNPSCKKPHGQQNLLAFPELTPANLSCGFSTEDLSLGVRNSESTTLRRTEWNDGPGWGTRTQSPLPCNEPSQEPYTALCERALENAHTVFTETTPARCQPPNRSLMPDSGRCFGAGETVQDAVKIRSLPEQKNETWFWY